MFEDYSVERTQQIVEHEAIKKAIITNTKWNMGNTLLGIVAFALAVVALALINNKT